MCIHHGRRSSKVWLDRLIRESVQRALPHTRKYWRLVHCVRSKTYLLSPSGVWDVYTRAQMTRVIRACARIVSYGKLWRRPLEHWQPPQTGAHEQLSSLVQYLFDTYPVPSFMNNVWWTDDDECWPRELYQHLANGAGVRSFKWPFEFPLTKPVARWFVAAPKGLSPFPALRWAQMRSLGSDDRLARYIATHAHLSESVFDELFWESVLRFLIRNMPICNDEISQIIWFIHGQKFMPGETVWGRGGGVEPLQPDFTVRGRSLMSLRRHMANWRDEVRPNLPPPVETTSWEPTPIGTFNFQGNDAIWTIRELLTDRELRVEGDNMHHCVADYIKACATRKTSIWSMRVLRGDVRRRVMTIEVEPESKTIWQAQGKRNSRPNSAAQEMLQKWAAQEQLILSECM